MREYVRGCAVWLMVTGMVVMQISCGKTDAAPDASGAFEAQEVLISSETAGVIRMMNVREGDVVAADSEVVRIDDTQLLLRKKQLRSQIAAVLSKTPDAGTQLATVQEQLHVAQREFQRVTMLVQSGSAPKKSLDDITGTVAVLEKQYEALKKSLDISAGGLRAETLPLLAQIDQLDDQIARCHIHNPMRGTVLATYAEQYEITAPGKALYKIADVSTLYLRAYAGGKQVATMRVGQKVQVAVDNGGDAMRTLGGVITWISAKAEFTPKTIQTKDERENLVYAIKVRVPNDGTLKIGMYGELRP